MFEEILPDLYRIVIPLPASPLKSMNSYLIKGDGRFLLIDTGMNREECLNIMSADLATLKVDLTRTDLFITHMHIDHIGLLDKLATDTSIVYFNRVEAPIVNIPSVQANRLAQMTEIYVANGFPSDILKASVDNHPGWHFGFRRSFDFHILKEGDSLAMGHYDFRCIETPGHTLGHLCLYEPDKKVFITGDHILFNITPNITSWYGLKNSLKDYLASLEKVYSLDVNFALPGHRNIAYNHRNRIKEIEKHHQDRLNEVLRVLEDGPKSVYQIAAGITWDIDHASWAEFPPQQKWFAFGETLAHVRYLEDEGTILKKTQNDNILFSLK